MTVRIQYNTALSAAVANGVAQSQTPLAGGNLTLNGSLVASGVATLDATAAQVNARQVLFTFAADESARTFTITGTVLAGGASVTEAVTGAAVTAVSSNFFITVTNIAVDAATAGALTVGTNGVGSSQWRAVDRHFNPKISLDCSISTGAANYGIEYTNDDLFDRTVTPIVYTHDTIALQAAASAGEFTKAIAGFRTRINSGTGTVVTRALPSTARV